MCLQHAPSRQCSTARTSLHSGTTQWWRVASDVTSFTIYSSSSNMAMGSGPSPVITSKLPGHPATMQPVTHCIPATSYSTSTWVLLLCHNKKTGSTRLYSLSSKTNIMHDIIHYYEYTINTSIIRRFSQL